MNYEQDISIDHDNLDLECVDQPMLLFRYSEHLATKQAEYAKVKEEFEVLKAETDREIRANPDSFGIGKLTETIVSNTTILQPEIKDKTKELNELRYEVGIASAAVEAVQHKKRMLEVLMQLHGQKYFSAPNTPRELTREKPVKELNKELGMKPKFKKKRK